MVYNIILFHTIFFISVTVPLWILCPISGTGGGSAAIVCTNIPVKGDRHGGADERFNADAAEKRGLRGEAAALLQLQRRNEVEAREKQYIWDCERDIGSESEVAIAANKSRRWRCASRSIHRKIKFSLSESPQCK